MKTVQIKLSLGLIAILLVVLSLIASTTMACQASFTWTQTSANVINFTNTSTGGNNQTMYQWSFGDGGYGYTQNAVYTYTAPGTYYVCLTMSDSNVCSSTMCDTIVVTGNVICVMTASTYAQNASCFTCADGYASATPNGGHGPFSYLWSPGGYTDSYVTTLLPGTYSVTITDVNNCTATGTATVDTCALHSSFTWSQTANNVISFTNTTTGASFFTSYFWNFGDGNYAYVANPGSHHYTSAGTYGVCLYVSDSSNTNSCYSTFCDTITVTGLNCNGLSISNTTTHATCNNCADGSMVTQTTGGTSPYTYHWTPNVSSTSSVYGLFPGAYQCCVTDAIGCTACTTGWVDSTNNNQNCSANFFLFPDSATAHLYWAVNNASGVQPLHYTWYWGDSTAVDSGAYPNHQYAQAGVYTICLTITDAVGCSSTYCYTDSLARTKNTMIRVNVRVPYQAGVPEVGSINNWSVYPNPVANAMTINYTLSSATEVTISLYDMLGNKVSEIQNGTQAGGQHKVNFDATNINQGLYLMQIKAGSKTLNQKVSVIK